MLLLAALSLGFLGSFHCIGMCGPIALALPLKRSTAFSAAAGSLVYNAGRIFSYALMGLLFGLAGQSLAMAGWQDLLSVMLGILILVLLFVPGRLLDKGPFFLFIGRLKAALRKLFGIHTLRSLLLIGMLNGLLPCGLVYAGIAGATATGSAVSGALFMAAFGLGTFPAMAVLSLAGSRISIRSREKVRKIVPVFITVMALLLILRGMNLGIPYISPALEKSATGLYHHQCCRK